MTAEEKYLLHLVKCVMCGEKLIKPEEGTDMMKLYKLTRRHQVTVIAYEALKGADFEIDYAFAEKLEKDYKRAILKNVAQEANFSYVSELFEKNKILFVPLKGIVLKNLYPQPHFRQSSDIDIYVPEKYTDAVYPIMREAGFFTEEGSIGMGMHDKYVLNKLVNIEVHRYLMDKNMDKWYRLSEEIAKSIEQKDGILYNLTLENHYLFVILHAVKHLRYAGIGMKSIMDVWVYIKAYKEKLNWDYINRMLKEYELYEIEGNLRALASYWFESEEVKNPVIKELSDYVIANGELVSKEEMNVSVAIEQRSLKHYARMFFMPYNEMAKKYKILKKMPFLLPAMWVYRAGYSVVKKDTIKNKIKMQKNLDKDLALKSEQFKKRIGIK